MSLYLFKIDAESGRAFSRIQNAKPAAGSCPEINNPSADPEALGYQIHCFGYLGQDLLNSRCNSEVFALNPLHEFQSVQQVEILRVVVALLGDKAIKFLSKTH